MERQLRRGQSSSPRRGLRGRSSSSLWLCRGAASCEAAPSAHGTAWLEPKAVAQGADGQVWSEVRLNLAPREIATVVYDPVEARKEWRDLDAERHVWAKVHRKEGR